MFKVNGDTDNTNLALCHSIHFTHTQKTEAGDSVAHVRHAVTSLTHEHQELCRQEPLVVEGFATYKLKALQVADRDNNYLL